MPFRGENLECLAFLLPLVFALFATAAASITAEDLRAVEDESTVRLTTIGRRSNQPRTVTIWFVHDGGRIYVQSGKDGKTDWYRNALAHPEVTLAISSLTLRGTARPVDDAAEVDRVHQMFRDKYLTARIMSWFGGGFGEGKVLVIEALEKEAGHREAIERNPSQAEHCSITLAGQPTGAGVVQSGADRRRGGRAASRSHCV